MQILLAAVDIEGPAEKLSSGCGDLGDEQSRTEVAVAGGGVEIGQAGGVDGGIAVVVVAA